MNSSTLTPPPLLASGWLKASQVSKGYKKKNWNQTHDSFNEYLLRASVTSAVLGAADTTDNKMDKTLAFKELTLP